MRGSAWELKFDAERGLLGGFGGLVGRILRVWKALGGSICRILRVWEGQILTDLSQLSSAGGSPKEPLTRGISTLGEVWAHCESAGRGAHQKPRGHRLENR